MHKAVSVRPGMHRGLWEDRDGKGHPKHTEKYSSKREAFSWFGSWWGCRGARNPRMGWGGHRMIDFRCISVEDLRYPAPRPGPGTSGVDALGSQETRLKRPPPPTKRQPQESQPIQVCGQPKDPLGSRRASSQPTWSQLPRGGWACSVARTRWLGGGERRGGVPAPQAPRPKSAGEPRGRGLGRTLPPSPPPSPHFPPRAACRHAGRPLPWQPSRRVCLRELCQPADPVARSPLPRDFRVGLEAEGQQKMAERSQTAPEAGLWGQSTGGEALRQHGCPGSEGRGDLGMALLRRRCPGVFARWGCDLGVRGQRRCIPLWVAGMDLGVPAAAQRCMRECAHSWVSMGPERAGTPGKTQDSNPEGHLWWGWSKE